MAHEAQKENCMLKKKLLVLCVVIAVTAIAVPVFAFTPAAGDAGYVIYDYANKMSTGAVGATIGLGGLGFGFASLFQGAYWRAIGCVLGGVGIANSAPLLTTIGAIF